MAYSATLANGRNLLSDEEHRRILNLFSRAGLSMDHHQFDEALLEKGTAAIMKTRDGLLRAAVPNPLGSCTFLNDVTQEEMNKALRRHKETMKNYPRNGEGLEAYVDASDTGYTENNYNEATAIKKATESAGSLNHTNGVKDDLKPASDGVNGSKGILAGTGINGAEEGLTNGTNGFTNGARG